MRAYASECYENNDCLCKFMHSISLANDVEFDGNVVSVLRSHELFV